MVDLLKIQIFELETKAAILDFKNVEFVSRSAAHELLVIKEVARQKNIEVSFENANEDVSEMLRIVAANRALPKAEKPRFEPEKTNIDSLREGGCRLICLQRHITRALLLFVSRVDTL